MTSSLLPETVWFYWDTDYDPLEGAYDVIAEYRAEVALFGDAWPGAADQVSDARNFIARYHADWDAFNDAPVFGPDILPVHGPDVPDPEPF